MICELPPGTPDDYARGFDLYLWIAAIVLHYVFMVIFIKRAKSVEYKSQKWLFAAYATFFGLYGITKILFIYAVWDPANYDFWVNLGYVFGVICFVPIIAHIEKFLVPKTKFIFTILGLGLFVVSLLGLFPFLGRDFVLEVTYIASPVLLSIVFILYMVLIKQSTGFIRTKTAWTLLGMIFFAIAVILDGEGILTLQIIPLWVAPVVYLVGILLMGIYQSKTMQ